MEIKNQALSRQLPATRVTPADWRRITQEAARLGVSVSELTRQALAAYMAETKGGQYGA